MSFFLLRNAIFACHLVEKKSNRTMINRIIWIIGIVWIGNIQNGVQAQQRNFIHPGITYCLVYQSKGNSLLSVASDSEVKTEPMQLPSSIQWTEREIGKLTLSAGACVLRLQIEQAGDKLEIQKIIVKQDKGI